MTAEMAFMFMERSQGKNRIDYPVSHAGGLIYNSTAQEKEAVVAAAFWGS